MFPIYPYIDGSGTPGAEPRATCIAHVRPDSLEKPVQPRFATSRERVENRRAVLRPETEINGRISLPARRFPPNIVRAIVSTVGLHGSGARYAHDRRVTDEGGNFYRAARSSLQEHHFLRIRAPSELKEFLLVPFLCTLPSSE